MPLYEYRCENCGHQFEKIQRFSDDPITVCPSCGTGPVVKLLSSPAIQFKGSGWYVTDYAGKTTKSDKSESESTSESKTEKTDKKKESSPRKTSETSDKASPSKASTGE